MGTYTSAAPTAAPSIPFGYWVECMKKYATFSGRARRAEYWSYTITNSIILIAFYAVVLTQLGAENVMGLALYCLYAIGTFMPGLAVAVRRLHDTGRSGWYILLGIIPLVNLVLVVFFFLDSHPGDNQYGPNPKGK